MKIGSGPVPEFTTEELTIALAGVGAVAIVCLVAVAALALRLSRVRKNLVVLRGNGDAVDIFGVVGRAMKSIDTLGTRVDSLVARQEDGEVHQKLALQRFGLVRYDAFEEMGGRLSFSAALLDDHGDGIVITSINGRTETRTYAKPIRQMLSEHNLSEEENAAIAAAMAGHGRTEPQAVASR